MKKKEKEGLTRWLVKKTASFAVSVWLICMFCLTLVTANNYYDMMYSASKQFNEDLRNQVLYGSSDTETAMLDTLYFGSALNAGVYKPEQHFDIQADYRLTLPGAVVFLDSEGNVIQESKDTIRFYWQSPEAWSRGSVEGWDRGWTNIDVQKRPELYQLFHSIEDIRYMKMTGYFSGREFFPKKIEAATVKTASEILKSSDIEWSFGYSDRIIRDLILEGRMQWQTIYEKESLELPENVMLTTIYSSSPEVSFYDKGKSIRFHGNHYENRVSLLKEIADERFRTGVPLYAENEESLLRFIYLYERSFEERNITMYSIIVGSPLMSAIVRLRYVYLLTGIVLLLGLWTFRQSIKKHLLSPVQEVNHSMDAGRNHINPDILNHTEVKELYELIDYFRIALNRTREDKDEIKRLNTALDYAKDAEESRRQLTSNLAHELKTPLAVIRSYSEGLQERIAEEKRDRYVQVIMDETDKLDSMVLEMLDLSRLEAGRVKLNRDTFSLADMAKSTFHRLSLLAEDKGLDVTFDFKDDCVILADEIRISQVITNLASNAVKYTPEGGWIRVTGNIRNGEVYFAVRNTSQPLHYEQLNKVWETFYRTDESRNSQGTGLGLAIAKNIIELHGGKVHAKNIKDGVEFGFKIKL